MSTAKETKKHVAKAATGKDVIKDSKPTQPVVFIVGESPLVEQFAELCAARRYSVLVQWNDPPTTKPTFASPGIKVAASVPSTVAVTLELTNINHAVKRANLAKLDKALPPTAPILSSSITVIATEQASWLNYKHRLVGFSALPSFTERPLVEVAATVFSPKETLDVAMRFFNSIGKEIELVEDRIGLVAPRIVCQIINEAAFALMEDIATPQDIDTAMKLGVNYPTGPIEWADRIGIPHVVAVLAALHNDLGEERYRVAPLLKQIAETGEWWKKN